MANEQQFDNRIDLSGLSDGLVKIKAEITKVIIGQEKVIDLILTGILANGHVLIEGVPGVAKTLMAKLIAKTADVDFSRIQFTPDLMPSDILGTSVFNQQKGSFEFNAGPIFSQIILIDEINRAPAKTQSALFEVMEERQVTVDGETRSMEEPFMVLATQNPIEQEGTYRLPEAQLDRFLFKISVDYPNQEEEVNILNTHHQRGHAAPTDSISTAITGKQILEYRQKIQGIHIQDSLLNYIATIVQSTRTNKSIYLGASPRASVNLLNASKAFAALQGRDFVTPEDIVFISTPVLRHRIILTPEKEMEGSTADDVIKQLIEKIEVPR